MNQHRAGKHSRATVNFGHERAKPVLIPGLGVDVPELRQARALWQIHRFDEALALFEAATRKYPQNLVALVDATRALGARFEIRRAEDLLKKLRKLGGNRPDILHLVGQTYRMIFRPQEAIECFEKVIAATSEIPDAFLELAVLYERRHLVEEALASIEKCLRAAPDYFEAHLFKARILRRHGLHAESEALFRSLATGPQSPPAVRAQAWAELAQKLDREGDYKAAMETMLKSKAILREGEAAVLREAEGMIGHLHQLSSALTKTHFQRWADLGTQFPAAKTAVLAGFPRSGTTLLEQVLDSHSGLVSSDEREAFGRDIFPAMWLGPSTPVPTAEALDALSPEKALALRRRYLDYMESALNEPIADRVHLDKNPPLTLLLPGFLRLFPEARVLIALRDPRDVVISCFMQYLPLNPNSVCFLTLERTAKRYANDLGAWLRLRDLVVSPWLEVRYENTVSDLEKEARRVLAFLGLPWEEQVLGYRDRLKSKAVGSPTYEAVSQPLYTHAVGRWRNYEELLRPLEPVLGPMIKALNY
jgi:thioredoxin-like negative regulator of GroEL